MRQFRMSDGFSLAGWCGQCLFGISHHWKDCRDGTGCGPDRKRWWDEEAERKESVETEPT